MLTKSKLTLTAIIFAMVLSAFAAAEALNGKWVGTTNVDGNDYALTYFFKVDGDKVSGTVESPYGVNTIENGKITGDEISFTSTVSGMEIPQKGKIYPDSVGLDITIKGMTTHATLKRPAPNN